MTASWKSPVGALLLTNRRCLLLTHPSAMSREWVLAWSIPLESMGEVIMAPKKGGGVISPTETTIQVGPGIVTQSGTHVNSEQLTAPCWLTVGSQRIYGGRPKNASPIRDALNLACAVRLKELHVIPESAVPATT